mmetsp:Transcript_2608/g.2966  ORF Transcript_2608/g.2966 Transcript_2608/m.2966 type:complete len:366 (+) Transcript_2608:122-1219(+)|eukprot:CAMPEP_0184013470 /NCGR_PEP_ID=MMETSP0954-20121128/5039_1 /TAXON_ID=627963 /ORGANISM="Aplanochytrium sp, Strain PBS07" /LENGTH=365 /DNA_ID=CAMNT_0026293679 /DNA_START=175 /DNA_END=1272 /DNA_ORIENTATION=-
MAEQAFAGASAIIDEDYELAISQLSEALAEDPNKGSYYDKRAVAYLALKKFKAACEDAEKAIGTDPTVALFYYRKGLAKFALEDYKACKVSMITAKEKHNAGPIKLSNKCLKRADMWLRKCDAELGEEGDEVAQKDVGNEDATTTKESTIKEKEQKSQVSLASSLPSQTKSIRHDYYQSFSHVVLSILAKGCASEDVNIRFGEDYVQVDIKQNGSELFSKSFFLHSAINPTESHYKIMKPKIEIKMKKAADGVQWPTLEREKAAAAPKITKAYASNRNWEAIDKQLAEEEDDDKPQGEDALNHLFKKIYKDASDETRRAMVKSFQTSGGTVLSTNWDEVAKKDYEKERVAPNGMVWKDNEGNTIS